MLDLGAMEWERPGRDVLVPPPGGRGPQPYPDIPRLSHREYGHRVGVFRLLGLLERLGLPAGVAIDVLTAEHYPALLPHLSRAGVEFLAHGLSASRPITSRMAADEERHYIAMTLERLEAALGAPTRGWLGAESSESQDTPAHLADAGMAYVADWGNDEQPYPMRTPAGELWALPLSWELSDVSALYARKVAPWVYGQSLVDAADTLEHEGQQSGRLLALHLHPWVTGQPFRLPALERALRAIASREHWWLATPGAVVAWCRQQQGSPTDGGGYRDGAG